MLLALLVGARSLSRPSTSSPAGDAPVPAPATSGVLSPASGGSRALGPVPQTAPLAVAPDAEVGT